MLILSLTTLLATQSLPNEMQVPGTLLSGPIAPEQGRTAIIAWHGNRVVTVPEPPGSQPGADLNIRIVDISNARNPVVTRINARAGGFNSHGYFHMGPYLYIGGHETTVGSGMYVDSLRINGSGALVDANIETSGLLVGTYNRSGAQSPWGAEMWWSYGEVRGNAWLGVRRSGHFIHDWQNGGAPTGPGVKATWDHLGQTGRLHGGGLPGPRGPPGGGQPQPPRQQPVRHVPGRIRLHEQLQDRHAQL